MNTSRAVVLVMLIGCGYIGLTASQTQTAAQTTLTMSAYLNNKWAYQPSWSPDGRYIAFLWDDWVRQNIYVVPSEGGTPVRVSDASNFIGNPSFGSAGEAPNWAPDGKRQLYVQDGDLFLTSVPDGKIVRLTDTADSETNARFSPDGREIVFSRGGDLYVLTLTTSGVRQLTRDHGGDSAGAWSPDGKLIAFNREPSNHVAWSPDYSGSLVSYHWNKPGPRDVGIIRADGGPVQWVAASPDDEGFCAWSPDSKQIAVERQSLDVKDRTILLAQAGAPSIKTLYHQRDQEFLASDDQHVLFSPDGHLVAVTSDEDGWNHLYVVPPDGGAVRQLTKGRFEVSYPSWTPDGRAIVYCSTENGTEQRQIYRVSVADGTTTRLTKTPGVNVAAAISPNGKQVLYLHSDPTHLPDVWLTSIDSADSPRQLADGMMPELHSYHWQTPQIVTFASQVDRLPIKAQLFVPAGFDKAKKYPAIVHTHEAAIYQEVYYGPGPQKDNVAWYGFNQRLAQEGYVVLNVDYRGSYGYGRDFRVGDYRDLGGNDAKDVISGVEYLRGLAYVDMNRIGVYGMSYGGHMVMTLLTKFPDVFRAGVDIAGVADFTLNYESLYGPWILGRLGTPEQNPDGYFQSSAINFLDHLRAPLLILHGTNDPNVTLLQSVMLIDQLLKKGKRFEFELYPGELHFFTKKRSWVDAFMKMERFFDEYVRHAPVPERAGRN